MRKNKLLLLLALLLTATTGAWAQAQTYKVTLQEGTEDATSWQGKAGEGEYQALPLEGVAAGTAVSVKYNGTKKVKSVKAVKKGGALATPLTIEAITAGTISVSSPKEGMQYSLDGGVTKTTMTATPTTINVAAGDKVAFYGNGTNITYYDGTNISGGTADVKVYGNIMSLVDEEHFATATTLTTNYQFYGLFYDNDHLKDASGLLLPATTLAKGCYGYMFNGCTSLTTAPALPATTLAKECYSYMFYNCESLTTAPALPATELAYQCYSSMFDGCESLTTAPALPATELAEGCYTSMFRGCAALTTAPELPAQTLALYCYSYMFYNCTSLTTAPELPAQTLVSQCYFDMFYNCRKLNSVTCLATSGINQNSSTSYWLYNAGTEVEGTKTFNAASSANWPMNNNSGIPEGWTLVTPAHTPLTLEALTAGTIVVQSPQSGMQYSLNGGAKTAVTSDAINVAVGDKVVFYGNGTSITSYNGTKIYGGTADYNLYGNIMSLVDEVNFATATTLTSTYAFNRLFSSGVSNIDNTRLKDASGLLLPATTLTENCYNGMFWGCSSLTAVPALPATTMQVKCYYGMFERCTSLTAAPALPATNLANDCYWNMFLYCTGLTDAPALPATTMYNSCYRQMFSGCTSLTTAPALPATTLALRCYEGMFKNCSNLASVTCLATNISATSCVEDWLLNTGSAVQGTKTFYKAASMTGWGTNIPSGWTVENAPNN